MQKRGDDNTYARFLFLFFWGVWVGCAPLGELHEAGKRGEGHEVGILPPEKRLRLQDGKQDFYICISRETRGGEVTGVMIGAARDAGMNISVAFYPDTGMIKSLVVRRKERGERKWHMIYARGFYEDGKLRYESTFEGNIETRRLYDREGKPAGKKRYNLHF